MSEQNSALTVVEPPQQLITIEPEKYVALVFEPFSKRLDDAKTLAAAAEFDVTTTAGMAVAVKHRATFREIRVESEKVRKLRKAPILEIGKLLDSRQKEIEAEIEPFESRFDDVIKAEEKRKDDEKIAKALAESQRITAIRRRISDMQAIPSMLVGKSSETIAAAIESLEAVEITLEPFAEFAGEAQMVKAASVEKLGEMLTAQLAIESAAAEAARQAEADRIERDRVAEANRIEAQRLADLAAEIERQAQAAREKQAEADRIAQDQREAADREAQAAREEADRLAKERRAAAQKILDDQAAELKRQQDAADEAARVVREVAEAAAKLEADHAEGLIENAAIDALTKLAAEARQQEEQRLAAEAERQRRERVQFEMNGPGDVEIVKTLAAHYRVCVGDVMQWMKKFDYAAADEQLAAENVAANQMEEAA